MSEFHPNRTKQVRTRPKLTSRRIFEAWPLLVWIAIAALAYFIYRGGVIFVRMNGIVDVYQENITPISEGRLIEVKFKRGDRVPPDTVVAVMDSTKYKIELESLKRDIIADRTKDIRDYDLEIIKLESDLREIQVADAEDSAIIKELEVMVAEINRVRPGEDPRLREMRQNDPNIQRSRVDLAKAKGRNSLNATHNSALTEAIKRATTVRDTFEKEAKIIGELNLGSNGPTPAGSPQGSMPLEIKALKARIDQLVKAAVLRDDEHQRFVELQTKIEQCELITPHGGIVDRIDKEVGEFIKPGVGVLKIVGDPEQVVCFLPQDQANDLKIGHPVWIASTSDKSQIFESTVTGISPRINNVPDNTSPLPNRRVHGRDIIVAYPREAIKDGKFLLLPGQTVIIHLEKPGDVPWINRIFHNDDNDTVR